MSEATPGTWSVWSGGRIVADDPPKLIGEVVQREGSEANAHLFAASKDLLAACEKALAVIGPFDFEGTWEEATEPLKAAIAKAKGTQ